MQSNGQPLGAGNEAPLADGDRLVIGGFELSVQRLDAEVPVATPFATSGSPTGAHPAALAGGAVTEDDPFADLLAGLAPSPTPSPTAPAALAPADALLFPNPMESQPRNTRASDVEPFADLLGPTPAATQAAGRGAFDDFSNLGIPASGKATSIDDLFGGSASMGRLGPHEGAAQITTEEPRQEGKRDNPRHSLPPNGETIAHSETEPGWQPHEQGGNQEGAVDRGKGKNTVVGIAK